MKSRTMTIGLIALITLALALTIYYVQQPIVLTLGVFAGSNWDVPSPKSTKIIDQAIARFEKENPNVYVEYESGIIKDDYSDWLTKKALKGNLPDIFMVLSDDLSSFASVGMLEDLDSWIQNDADFDVSHFFFNEL